ncbi:putative capsid protein [Freshwater macrophyte associated picobirna-like virus 1]|nr:putative capsid protein [Freshwater macrophyte associated picobirna-like virus 1]
MYFTFERGSSFKTRISMTERKLFVPGQPPVMPNTFDFAVSRQPLPGQFERPGILNNPGINRLGKVGKVLQMSKEIYDRLPPETKDQLHMVVDKAGNKIKDKFKFTGGTKMGKGNNHSSGYSLSKAPDPIETRLDTGITPNAYTSDYLDAKQGFCSPLHMSSGVLRIPTLAGNLLLNYFNKVIAFDLQTKAQANIGFNLNVNTDFSSDKILAALNALIEGLSVYCYYMSIISYHSDPANKNEGMISLRLGITPDMLDDLAVLGRRLADTPCPPNLVEFIRYIYGNYFSGNNQGSPMIKFAPFALSNTMYQATAISSAFTLLSLPDNNQVYTLLRRSVPQWKINAVKDVFPTPAYDENFKTIFANMPFTYMVGSALSHRPHTPDGTTTIAYNSYSNILDGAAYAMCSIFKTASTEELEWNPGLFKPAYTNSVANGNSRMSYYEVGGSKAFYPVNANTFLTRSRAETYSLNDAATDTTSVHLFGSDMVKGVCVDTLTETAYNVFDYLMSLDTIKLSTKQSGFNPAAGKSRTRK